MLAMPGAATGCSPHPALDEAALTHALRYLMKTSPTARPSGAGKAQPNDAAGGRFIRFSVRLWVLAVLTGIGTGIGAGLLVELLRLVQHLCYSYNIKRHQELVLPHSRCNWAALTDG